MFTEYLAAEGLEQGVYDSVTKINSENTGTSGDIPGTDSNDEPDYYIQTSGSGNSTYSEEHYNYKPSERVTQTVKNSPFIDHEKSRMALTFRKAVQITEESLEEAGELENTTFERYVETHQSMTEMDDQDEIDALKQLFSDASGIPVQNISLRVYEEAFYIGKATEEGMNLSLILEILLAALIVGLLLFVVFRAMKPAEVVETEPELSVERLLATTRENQSLEDIEFGEKSETRKMIEKYIDENADAVAALLRNWLNDDGWE
ncbi:MAG: flagellar M-ring protein FliF, partial [Lachnospiraceae bacterium]|nr:flagellar M-ring protein FliF [Lachnospiraceae bacterium]